MFVTQSFVIVWLRLQAECPDQTNISESDNRFSSHSLSQLWAGGRTEGPLRLVTVTHYGIYNKCEPIESGEANRKYDLFGCLFI